MKKLKIGTLLIAMLTGISTGASKPESKSVLTLVKDVLGEKISKIESGKTKADDLKKLLGTPAETVGDIYYYDINGKKYDLSIATAKGTVESFVFDVPKQDEEHSLKFSSIEKWVTPAIKEKMKKDFENQKGHSRGRKFNVDFPEYGMHLEFDNIDDKRLSQVQFYAKESVKK